MERAARLSTIRPREAAERRQLAAASGTIGRFAFELTPVRSAGALVK
jgi:hypothetical protein